jgi:transcriptional regulator with XRE-family HTH domain
MTTIASGIKEMRLALGLKQPEFAELLGVSFRSLCRYEAGLPLIPSAVAKLVKVAKEKKFQHLADFFRAYQKAEIRSRLSSLSSAGSPRRITATELRQWDTTLSKAFFGLNSALKSQKDRMESGAFYVMCDYVNMVEDVRSYIASYAGEHDDTTLVCPYGSHLQADEAKKLVPRKTPAKRGRPPKSAATKKQLKPQKPSVP